jgi:phage tail sheath gpL-like
MPIKRPKVTLSIIPATQLAGVVEQKVLIVGQMLAAGTAVAGDLIQDLGNDGSEDTLFGRRSHMAGMVRAFKRENEVSQLDVIPLDDDGAAVKGTAVAAVTGTATEDGSIFVTVGSETDHRYEVDISDGDTATDVGDAIVAAFANDLDAPFTQANVTGTVTFTAENGGTLCNDWSIKIEGAVAGISIALTGWTGGATDPTLTTVLDVIANIRYQTILWPSAYALDVVQTELDARFNTANAIMDGVAVQVKADTLANLKTYADQNSQSIVIPGNKVMSETDRIGSATVEMPDIAAAEICAIRALRRHQDAVLTEYLTTAAALDQFGGIAISSLPYFNTALPNLPVADPRDEFTDLELDELTDNGISVYGPNQAFNGTIFGEFVTTYLTDTAANVDDSYKYLNTVDTASVIREFYFTNLRSRYAQTRLTDGDLVAGRDMANESSIRAFCNQLYDELAEEALVQRGQAAKESFNDNLVITVDVRNGSATINMAPLLVSQLRVILGTIQINFGGN